MVCVLGALRHVADWVAHLVAQARARPEPLDDLPAAVHLLRVHHVAGVHPLHEHHPRGRGNDLWGAISDKGHVGDPGAGCGDE